MNDLRWDEVEEMDIAEDAGIIRGTVSWSEYLDAYRGTMRWHWISAGGTVDDLRAVTEPPMRRVFHETMGYELPK